MSYNVFPTFAGRGWGIKKRPITRTLIQQADSGAEYRTQRYQYPLYEFDIEIPYLTQADSDTLIGFYNQQGGPFQPFYLSADNDNAVTLQPIGTTDGTTTQYQLVKSNGSYWVEPIMGVQGSPSIYRTDWQGRQLLYSTPRTNYCRNSDQVGGTYWSTGGSATYAQNAGTAPDGTNRATQVTADAGSGPYANSVAGVAPGTMCAAGIFAKAGTATKVYVTLEGAAYPVYLRATFDLIAGTVAPVGGHAPANYGITPLPDGWYFCWVSGPSNSSNSSYVVADYYLPTAGSLYLFGGQIALSAAGTGAYISTTTAAVTVTDYTLSDSGALAIADPTAGALLTWTGQYYYLVRFKDDQIETTQTLSQIYEATTLTLRSVR